MPPAAPPSPPWAAAWFLLWWSVRRRRRVIISSPTAGRSRSGPMRRRTEPALERGEAMAIPTDLVGRSQSAEDIAQVEPLALLAALLESDRPLDIGSPVPPAWHWVYFVPPARQGALGP